MRLLSLNGLPGLPSLLKHVLASVYGWMEVHGMTVPFWLSIHCWQTLGFCFLFEALMNIAYEHSWPGFCVGLCFILGDTPSTGSQSWTVFQSGDTVVHFCQWWKHCRSKLPVSPHFCQYLSSQWQPAHWAWSGTVFWLTSALLWL